MCEKLYIVVLDEKGLTKLVEHIPHAVIVKKIREELQRSNSSLVKTLTQELKKHA